MRWVGCMPDAHQVMRRCQPCFFNPGGISKFLAALSIPPRKMVGVSHPHFTPQGWAGAPFKKYTPIAAYPSITQEHFLLCITISRLWV